MAEQSKIAILVQCTYSDLGRTTDPSYYCIQVAKEAYGADSVVLAAPDIQENHIFNSLAREWGVKLHLGSEYNVARRLLEPAIELGADVIVRILLKRFYLDTDLVSRMVSFLNNSGADYVNLPLDFNYEFGGDVLRTSALRDVVDLLGEDDVSLAAYRFSPWRYIEEHPEHFKTVTLDEVPVYPKEKVRAIKEKLEQVVASEDILYGEHFPASRYHFVTPLLNPDDRVLDMACGVGHGTSIIGERCQEVVGVDYSSNDVESARTRYKYNKNMRFEVGDAHTFLDGEPFDVVVSMHTMEHLDGDAAFLKNVRRNLNDGGRLILEVPLLLPRPLGEPLYPFHKREYIRNSLDELVRNAGFEIQKAFGVNRGVYVDGRQAREAIQLHCLKK